jgi:hypothetical protein
MFRRFIKIYIRNTIIAGILKALMAIQIRGNISNKA